MLDTCTIYSGLRRDLLLTMVAANVYRLVLTEDILAEIEDVERRKLRSKGVASADAAGRAAHLTQQLRQAFPVLSEDVVDLIRPVGLPDANDEHIVAAAVAGQAEVIVTDNIKDFPIELLPDGMRVLRPPTFLQEMITANPTRCVWALVEMSSRRTRPPQRPRDLIDLLLRGDQLPPEGADILRWGLGDGA